MNFKVVPFIANIDVNQGAGDAAKQLQELINNENEQGWQYVKMENIDIMVHDPGKPQGGNCFTGITQAVPPSSSSTKYNMVVFQKK
jgi:hypothetical protein